MIDRIKLTACYVVIVLLLALLAWSAAKNYQFSGTISDQAKTIKLELAESAALKAYVSVQDAEVERLEQETFTAHQVAEKAKADSISVIEAEERRISGIRSAPKAQSCDEIHTKMLQDATL